jgi:CO dehydrogenase/acetyl-CoA synthase gamma subunit (corrinoid Fe-S protein)
MLLSIKEVEKLLDWSDVKPKVVKNAVPNVAALQPMVVAQPKVDVHAMVKATIAGDVSKSLIGDDLLSLKGLFYDGHEFAVVEVENIITKKIQYYRAKVNESLASHQLVKIGKNHVLIKSGEQNVKLQMFDNF